MSKVQQKLLTSGKGVPLYPPCGVRGTWSRLRFRDGVHLHRKKAHRTMKFKGWTLPT